MRFIYLSDHKCAEVDAALGNALPVDSPVVCCSRIGWPEEKIVYTALGTLAADNQEHRFGRQTVLRVLASLICQDAKCRFISPEFGRTFSKMDK